MVGRGAPGTILRFPSTDRKSESSRENNAQERPELLGWSCRACTEAQTSPTPGPLGLAQKQHGPLRLGIGSGEQEGTYGPSGAGRALSSISRRLESGLPGPEHGGGPGSQLPLCLIFHEQNALDTQFSACLILLAKVEPQDSDFR